MGKKSEHSTTTPAETKTSGTSETSETETTGTETSGTETTGSETSGTETTGSGTSESETTGTGTTETGTETETSESDSETQSSDSEEDKAIRQAKLPESAFTKRVPQSFYEKEKKLLGRLDHPWEVAYTGPKPYFVNHDTKTTSWVDPRTKKTREIDIMKCKPKELPYGWEEEIDSEIGVYYIDHNTQSTFLDPPWDPRIQFQVAQLARFLAEQISILKKKMQMEEEEEIQVKKKVLQNVSVLENEKKKLQEEIEFLKRQAEALAKEEKETKEKEKEERAKEKEERAKEKEDKKNDASSTESSDSDDEIDENKEFEPVPDSLEEFKQRIQELARMQQLLVKEPGVDEVNQYKEAQEEIQRVQDLIKKEEEAREKIARDIEELKNQLRASMGLEPSTSGSGGSGADNRDFQGPIRTAEEIAEAPPRKAQLSRRTIYEMHMELMALNRKLKTEKLSLAAATTTREGNLPGWIKQLEDVAVASKTVRVKLQEKAKQGAEKMSFRERLTLFAAAAADNQPRPTYVGRR